jgi:Curlin associated repeat
MKYVLLMVVTAMLGLAPLTGQGQNAEREGISGEQQLAERLGTERLPLTSAPPLDGPNTSVLLQTGEQNQATVQQRYAGATGHGNLVQIVQAGAANVADIGQYGAANRSSVDQQGNGNRVDSQLTGTGIESVIRQDGNQNAVQQDLSQDGRRYLIEQQGSHNELNQRETSAAPAPGYEVRMQGTGIRLTIEQGRVLP